MNRPEKMRYYTTEVVHSAVSNLLRTVGILTVALYFNTYSKRDDWRQARQKELAAQEALDDAGDLPAAERIKLDQLAQEAFRNRLDLEDGLDDN